MSYIKLSGVGDDVSGEAIVNGMNAEGLACTGVSKSMEGTNAVFTFELADGEAAAYRNAQTRTDVLIKFSDALKRAGVYITRASPRTSFEAARGNQWVGLKEHVEYVDIEGEGSLIMQVTRNEPPPSLLPYGSLAWAEQLLPCV